MSEGVGGVMGVLGGWQGLSVLRDQKGYRGHWDFFGCREPFGVSGGVGVSGVHWGGKWTGSQPHWAQVQGPSTPTGGVTYLANPKQVTEMSSAGYYIHLELYFVTVFTFVSMPPHHIFLHAI